MALYLDEVWIKDPSPQRMKEFVKMIGMAAKNPASIGAPPEVKFVAGPWASNEEPKVIFLVDIPNHTPTYQIFGKLMSISDTLMWRYFELLSFEPMATIQQWREQVVTGLNPRDVKFRFTGSVMSKPDPSKDDQIYGADLSGTLIAIYPVTDETVLQTSLTMKEEKYLKLEVDTAILPKEGTAVKLIIEAAK